MTPRQDLIALPVDEKLNITEQLWDSLAPAEKSLPVPGWHSDELQKRQMEIDANPGAAISWVELKRQLLRSRI